MTDNDKEELLATLQVAIEDELYVWHKEQVSVLAYSYAHKIDGVLVEITPGKIMLNKDIVVRFYAGDNPLYALLEKKEQEMNDKKDRSLLDKIRKDVKRRK